jgi:competence protein ComGC
MIVVLIIGILVAIAVPVFVSSREQSQISVCRGNLRSIDSAVVRYSVEYNSYPADIGQLVPTYIKDQPRCPAGGVYSLDNTEIPPRARCSMGHTY